MIDGDDDAIFDGLLDGAMGSEVGRADSLFCLSSWIGVIDGGDVVIVDGLLDGTIGSEVGSADSLFGLSSWSGVIDGDADVILDGLVDGSVDSEVDSRAESDVTLRPIIFILCRNFSNEVVSKKPATSLSIFSCVMPSTNRGSE